MLLEGLQFTVRFNSVKDISDTFSFLWNYQKMSEEDLKYKAAKLAEKYYNDISCEDFLQKIKLPNNGSLCKFW